MKILRNVLMVSSSTLLLAASVQAQVTRPPVSTARIERQGDIIGVANDARINRPVLRRLNTRIRNRIDRYYDPQWDAQAPDDVRDTTPRRP